MTPRPEGQLVELAAAVEREGHTLARKVRRGELTRSDLVRFVEETGDGEPAFALRLLDADAEETS